MEEQIKEIEGLLETTAHLPDERSASKKFKKYVRLIFPHVALVAVVCLYAVVGAYAFYSLESPNEDNLKKEGKATISNMRSALIATIQYGEGTKKKWQMNVDAELYTFSDRLYKAFKEQYVRYPDVRTTNFIGMLSTFEDSGVEIRRKRHRQTKGRGVKEEKMWTASSALFFAATTMATIGYGNIVPATPYGRIACVIFALFGAPLAIITIGDLGKFLSECTIWLYKQMRKVRNRLKTNWRQFRGVEKGELEDIEKLSEETRSHSTLHWEDLVMDKTEVPVIMVFTILLLYIAFGGVLFSFLEGWSYMDAFYYSFISLTTIGFGDIVPENHDYIVLMLIYLGVGLAVTTMCIDLVGIQYIQKIHYFGRKFRGTDLLHLLKRKRMIERRLAMGQGEEILQMYLHQIQKEMPDAMEPPSQVLLEVESKHIPISKKLEELYLSSRQSFMFPSNEDISSPEKFSINSFHAASIWSNSSASARSMMFSRLFQRGGSWDESGPALSDHCSVSTEPSVHIRQAYWDSYHSPVPSVTSFLYEFSPLASPDYQAIAICARRSRRLRSCPNSACGNFPTSPQSPIGLACMEDWDTYIQMLEDYSKPYNRAPAVTPPVTSKSMTVLSKPAFTVNASSVEVALHQTTQCYVSEKNVPNCSVEGVQQGELLLRAPPTLLATTSVQISSPASAYTATPLPSSTESRLVCPITVALNSEVFCLPEEQADHVKEFQSPMPMESSSDEDVEDDDNKNGIDLDLGAFELVDSGMTPETLLSSDEPVIFHQSLPVHSVHHDTVQTEAALANLMSAPSSMLSGAIPPIMVEDNYCFVVDGERVRMGDILGDDQWWRHTSRPTKYFYSEDLRQFHRVNCITAKGKVITAKLSSGVLQVQNAVVSSSSTTPRSSVSAGASSTTTTRGARDNKVPLTHVYKVIRFYSFWKTCTSFHRIVTMIDKVSSDDRHTNPEFKRRLFVQYLWRNAKAVEKARVQKEFDPRRQRLLRFVTDPSARKRFQKM